MEKIKKKNFVSSKLLKLGTLSVIGTFLIKAVNLISLPVFSRLLTPSEYGNVTLFMTYVTIFSIILGLDFNNSVAKGSLEYKDTKESFLASGIVFTFIFSIVILAISNMFGNNLFQLIGMQRIDFNLLLIYSYASFIVSYVSADYIFQFDYTKNMLLCSSVALLNFLCSVILILTIFKEQAYWGRVIGASIPTIIIAVICMFRIVIKGWNGIAWKYIKYSIKFSVPLIPHNLSGLILSQADKVMISNMIGAFENGIYSLVYNVGWMLSVLIEALNNVWMPWMFRKLENKEVAVVKKVADLYLSGFTIIGICVAAISPELVKLVAPQTYWEGIDFVTWVVYATYVVFLYYFYVNIELFYKQTHMVSVGTIMAAGLNVGLNLWGMNVFGYAFAAISTLIAYIGLLIFHSIIVNVVMKETIVNNKFIFMFLLLMFLFTLILQQILDNFMLRIGVALIGIIVVTIIAGIKFIKAR